MQTPPPGAGKRTSTSSTGSRKSDRRRSLPLSVELSPTVSEFERPDVTDFQWRRRKAAKLTQFFGVNHREVIEEVLQALFLALWRNRRVAWQRWGLYKRLVCFL